MIVVRLQKRSCLLKTIPSLCRALHSQGNLKDPFKILGVKRGASDEEIKSAFIQKCKEFHPDCNPSGEAVQKFMDVRDAFDMIGKSESRKKFQDTQEFGKSSGMNEAMRQAFGKGMDYEPDFSKFDRGKDRLNKKMHQDRQSVYEELNRHQFGEKSNMENFDEWEKKHFGNLNVRDRQTKTSPFNRNIGMENLSGEEKRSMKRMMIFGFAVLCTLLLIELFSFS